ncbi:MAG: hypothetical protein IKM02_07845 [Clostridia bacterium]|nr:hypothetical protein [Clostridia bacterium]
MKKLLASIMILALALSASAFAAEVPADISGLWHAILAEGESTLFLRPDGTGSLNTGGTDFPIAWNQALDVVTLDQGGALVNGVYDEAFISLAIGGGNLIFLREKPEPQPLDGDISGTWRAPLMGGDSILTLNADGSAILDLGPEAVNLTWTHEGPTVTLLQEGFPIECIYDGVFISIFLGEGSVCFMKTEAEVPAQ